MWECDQRVQKAREEANTRENESNIISVGILIWKEKVWCNQDQQMKSWE